MVSNSIVEEYGGAGEVAGVALPHRAGRGLIVIRGSKEGVYALRVFPEHVSAYSGTA
jgi:hypothetical protein